MPGPIIKIDLTKGYNPSLKENEKRESTSSRGRANEIQEIRKELLSKDEELARVRAELQFKNEENQDLRKTIRSLEAEKKELEAEIEHLKVKSKERWFSIT